jgi:hypothetical protein
MALEYPPSWVSLVQLACSSASAVARLIDDTRRLTPFVVDEEWRAGDAEWCVGQHVLAVPLHHHTVGGEEVDGILTGAPGAIVHGGLGHGSGASATTTPAFPVDHLGRRHLGSDVADLALDGVAGDQLSLVGEQVDVADLVGVGVAEQTLVHVPTLRPATGLHCFERIRDLALRGLHVALGDGLAGTLCRLCSRLWVVDAGRCGQADDCDEQDDEAVLLDVVHGVVFL